MLNNIFHLFGIRHHGAGCSQSLLKALIALNPDLILIEGPPEAEDLIADVVHPEMEPPVTLLVYNPENPEQAVFYPFASFSPEWNALRYAVQNKVPVKFIDLPVAHKFALENNEDSLLPSPLLNDAQIPIYAPEDPLDWIGVSAGYEDGEAWWNHFVEERIDGVEIFAAIQEVMSAIRTEYDLIYPFKPKEALREAFMRKNMREAQKKGYKKIAVITGAWHSPALVSLEKEKEDNALIKSLPKIKTKTIWTPWTYQHLSFDSGYGAGIASPMWYEHLWKTPSEKRTIGWLAKAAAIFRSQDIDCSSAHIIEAVRFAEALSTIRGKHHAGIGELTEALETVVCMGNSAPLELIKNKLVIGEKIGNIPSTAEASPLQKDIEDTQKKLRLKPNLDSEIIKLDLRESSGLSKSHLLHRLNILEVFWGKKLTHSNKSKGTFHENWQVQWKLEFIVTIIAANKWGNTITTAASNKAVDFALTTKSLPELSNLISNILMADLPDVMEKVVLAMDNLCAATNDVEQMLQTLPALTNIVRYGNIRKTDSSMVNKLLDHLIPRAIIGLPNACSALNDEAAANLKNILFDTNQAISILENPVWDKEWNNALKKILQINPHGLIAGLSSRLLLDNKEESLENIALQMSQAMSSANPPSYSADWIDGFLNNNGIVLLYDNAIWGMLNQWVLELQEEHFYAVLPILRRTFAKFSTGEKQEIAKKAAQKQTTTIIQNNDYEEERSNLCLPLLKILLRTEQ